MGRGGERMGEGPREKGIVGKKRGGEEIGEGGEVEWERIEEGDGEMWEGGNGGERRDPQEKNYQIHL